MFTGVIEEIGIVKDFKKNANSALICVECAKILEDTKLGDSIAINGVCQTVIEITPKSFSAEISAETLSVTNFSKLKPNETVNLERALMLKDRLDGHIVSGHVDCSAQIVEIKQDSGFYNIKIKIQPEFSRYIVKKGSITVNGISLTVANISLNIFELAIIPHTFNNTNLKSLEIGSIVNIEVDILAKYVEKLIDLKDNKITEGFLAENGFV